MSSSKDVPVGYQVEEIPSPYVNHMGRVFTKKVMRDDGTVEAWSAFRVEAHHVNAWNFAHGALIAGMAEIGTSQPVWDPAGPGYVAIDLTIQFIGAPKLGDLIEVCGTLTRRTRSLAFTAARGEVAGQVVFLATSVQKQIRT